jgi:hypothetical protein
VVTHVIIPALKSVRQQEELEFKANLGYVAKTLSINK